MAGLGIGWEVLIVLALILTNGVFAMSEIAVITARRARLLQRAEAGDARARRALELAENPNRFLATAQIGITMVGIFAGAFGGATVATQVSAYLQRFALLAPFSELLALAMVVLAITYLSLVVGELVPKRIALTYPERIAIRVAGPMHVLSRLAAPAVKLLSYSTDALLRLLKVRKEAEPPVTEEEIAAMIRLGTDAGVFEEAEQDLVERVFKLGDQPVSSLMTPRRRIVWLDVQAPAEASRRKMIQNRVSRFLVCENSLDRLLGMVSVPEMWARMLAGQPLDLRASLREPLFVPPELRALRLLDLFRETGVHLAIVQGEQGTIQGLVTLTDVLEQLSGEVFGLAEPRIIRREDGSWLLDGSLLMTEVWDTLGVARLAGDAPTDGHTLGGYVVTHLGRIPISGEYFEDLDHRFEIMDMDGSHVDKVLVSRTAKDEGRRMKDEG